MAGWRMHKCGKSMFFRPLVGAHRVAWPRGAGDNKVVKTWGPPLVWLPWPGRTRKAQVCILQFLHVAGLCGCLPAGQFGNSVGARSL